MEQMTQEAVEEADQELDSSFTTSLDLADSMNSYFSTLENLPEADLVTSILTRYTDIIFDNVADAENPGAQEAVAGDVSQELSVQEGHVTQAEALPMFQQILDTAKSDEELKGLIETWTEAMNDPDYTYETFLEAIEDMEKDLDTEADETDESGFILRAWVDSDGEVVGRQFLLNDEQEEELFGYLCTADGDKRGFSMQLGSGDDKVAIEGSGELKGDLLSGTYTISSGEADAAVIDVTDYDTKAVQDGIWKGTYSISGAPVEDEDGNVKKNAVDDMAGRDSGGEGQNPKYVALLAGFAMLHMQQTNRDSKIRLVLLDEAFSKMDKERSEVCLHYARDLELQLIVCVPDERLQSLIRNVDSVYGFRRYQNQVSMMHIDKGEYLEMIEGKLRLA